MYSPLSEWGEYEVVVCGSVVKGHSSVMQWLVDEAVNEVGGREIWRFCCTVRHRQRHSVSRSMADWLGNIRTADAVDHRVNSLKVRRPSETTPRTGGIRKACDDDSTVHVVKCYIINPMRTQDTHRLRCLRTRRHQPLDMLGDRQIVSDAHAQDLRAVAECYSWERCRLWSCGQSHAVFENNVSRLAAI